MKKHTLYARVGAMAGILILGAGVSSSLAASFNPDTDNTHSLGSSTLRWKSLFVGPDALVLSNTASTSGSGANYTMGSLRFSTGASLSLGTQAVGTGSAGSLEFRTSDLTRLFVSSGGNVGVGTTNPGAYAHVVGSTTSGNILFVDNYVTSAGGGGSFIKYRKARGTPASPTVVAVGDRIGGPVFQGYDGTKFVNAAQIVAAVEQAPGANDMPTVLDFLTTPDNSATLTQRMRINSTGRVGVGIASKLAQFTVKGSNSASGLGTVSTTAGGTTVTGSGTTFATALGVGDRITVGAETKTITAISNDTSLTVDSAFASNNSGATFTDAGAIMRAEDAAGATALQVSDQGRVGVGVVNPAMKLHVSDASDGGLVRLQDSDGTCDHDPEAGSEVVTCSSDARLKTNVTAARPVLNDLMKLKLHDYDIISSGDRTTGVIAQEVQKIFPDMVSTGPDNYLMVRQPSTWELVKAVQEQQEEIEALKAQVKALLQKSGIE